MIILRFILRFFGITLLVIPALILNGCLSGGQSVHENPPNILFILTDDHSKTDMGAYGHSLVKTPNMDQLATESMVFENAFTNTAMCVPSRTSLYTGLYPMRHGAHPNHAPVRRSAGSVAKHLETLGYQVGLIGKVHVNPVDAFGFHYVKDLLDYAWDEPLTKEEMLLAMETLDKDGKPFVLFVCIANPHTPWPGEWEGDPGEIRLPGHLFDDPKTRLTVSRYYAHVEFADRKVGEAIEASKQLDLYDDMVVFFSSDHGAELVHGKYTLYDAGIKVPFMVRWPGEVEAGTRTTAMIQFVDVVPTLIEMAGGEAPDTLDGRSILPVLKQEREAHHDYIFATSSKDGIKTDYPIKAIRSEKFKYILNPEYEETYSSWITDSTLGEGWPGYDRHYGYWLSWLAAADSNKVAKTLVSNYLHRPAEELYDLERDPDELHNVAGDPVYDEIKADLRERLEEWMVEQGDVHYTEDFFNALPGSSKEKNN
jgi:N-sulfoglucosamine sulfohydrolase